MQLCRAPAVAESVDVADVVKQGRDDEAVLRNSPATSLGQCQGLEGMVCHATSVLMVAVASNCKVIAAVEK